MNGDLDVEAFLKQLNLNPDFDLLLGDAALSAPDSLLLFASSLSTSPDDASLKTESPSVSSLQAACQELQVLPQHCVVVAADMAMLRAAKQAGCFVTHFMVDDQARRSSHANEFCRSFLGFQGVVEQYNGVSYRSSKPFIHVSKYAGGD